MGQRKSPGEGNIRQMPNGRYRGGLVLGYKLDGTRNVFRCVGDTKDEVRAAFRKAHAANDQGDTMTSSKQTVAQFLSQWQTDVAKPLVSARTYSGYQDLIERHVLPAFAHTKLSQLRPAHLQKLYNAKSEELSPTTVLHIHRCLHSAFKTAVRWDMMPRNPCERVDPPKVAKREQQALSPQEAIGLYRVALEDEDYGPFFMVALVTGLRMGELYALHWDDIDWQGQRLMVRHAYSSVRGGVGRILKSTKTDKGRPVHLINAAASALQRQRRTQAEYRLQAGVDWKDNNLVFATRLGSAWNEGDMRRRLLSLLARADLPTIRPYDLRHSAASDYLALGVPPKDVSQLLGHSAISITMDTYGHSFPTVQAEAMQRMDELLSFAGSS